MAFRTERTSFNADDFIGFEQLGSLVITPKFQRRNVWKVSQQSYLIDTILQGLPVPPIYLRSRYDRELQRTVREVIDGQQRITALLSYVRDEYALSKTLLREYSGLRFSKLTVEQQEHIKTFQFVCEILHGAADADVLEIFSRVNTFSVKLSPQELRNGYYFGHFKQTAYSLAYEHLTFWRKYRLFSETDIARMREVELVSELLIAAISGMQDKKASINDFYDEFDEEFPQREELLENFRVAVDALVGAVGDVLPQTRFTRTPLFYSLFLTVYHLHFGVPRAPLPQAARSGWTAETSSKLREAVLDLSDVLTGETPVNSAHDRFIRACAGQTDNIGPRNERLSCLLELVAGSA